MTKPIKVPRVGVFHYGREFSPWFPATQFEQCCTCGATHEQQFRVEEEGGEYVVYVRARKAIGRTKIARRWFASVLQKVFDKIDGEDA